MGKIQEVDDGWQAWVSQKSESDTTDIFKSRGDAEQWIMVMESRHMERLHFLNHRVSDLLIRFRTELGEPWPFAFEMLFESDLPARPIYELHGELFRRYRTRWLLTRTAERVRTDLQLLERVFETARTQWNYPLPENPLARVVLPPPLDRPIRDVRDAEIGWLEDVARDSKDQEILLMIDLAVETGMRRSEILALRAGHFLSETDELSVGTSSKGRRRLVKLTSEMAEAVRQQFADGRSKLIQPQTVTIHRRYRDLVRRAGLYELQFEHLHDAALFRMLGDGHSVKQVAALTGERDTEMIVAFQNLLDDQVD